MRAARWHVLIVAGIVLQAALALQFAASKLSKVVSCLPVPVSSYRRKTHPVPTAGHVQIVNPASECVDARTMSVAKHLSNRWIPAPLRMHGAALRMHGVWPIVHLAATDH